MSYKLLSNFLHQKGYTRNKDYPRVFIRRSQDGFCIISVYVDDLNIIGTPRDIEETYSPVMAGITFRYLISMAVNLDLTMKFLDVVNAYLYGNLDLDFYMMVSEGIPIPNQESKSVSIHCSSSEDIVRT